MIVRFGLQPNYKRETGIQLTFVLALRQSVGSLFVPALRSSSLLPHSAQPEPTTRASDSAVFQLVFNGLLALHGFSRTLASIILVRQQFHRPENVVSGAPHSLFKFDPRDWVDGHTSEEGTALVPTRGFFIEHAGLLNCS